MQLLILSLTSEQRTTTSLKDSKCAEVAKNQPFQGRLVVSGSCVQKVAAVKKLV